MEPDGRYRWSYVCINPERAFEINAPDGTNASNESIAVRIASVPLTRYSAPTKDQDRLIDRWWWMLLVETRALDAYPWCGRPVRDNQLKMVQLQGISSPGLHASSANSESGEASWSPRLHYSQSYTGFDSPAVGSTPIAECKRPSFRSTRLKETDSLLSETVWTKSRAGKRAGRRNYIFFLVGVTIGVLAGAGFLVQGFLSVKKNNYCLVLEDNFDGPLDTSVWKHELQTGGFGNHEFQWTTDSLNNSFTEDGHLYIVPTLTSDQLGMAAITNGYQLNLTQAGTCTASNRTDANCAATSNSTIGTILPPVQSARLTTRGTRSIKFGRVEVRAKLSKGDWTWPAIWMMPRDNTYGEWPASGEIDIVESKGNIVKSRRDYFGNVIRSTLHYGPNSEQDHWYSTTAVSQILRNYFYDGFETFGLEWDEDSIWTWRGSRARRVLEKKFDRDMWSSSHFQTSTSNGTVVDNPWKASKHAKIAPFDQDFYLILNVAVGGTNGYFADNDVATPDKPWSNSGANPRADFWSARESWFNTWPKDPKKREQQRRGSSVFVYKYSLFYGYPIDLVLIINHHTNQGLTKETMKLSLSLSALLALLPLALAAPSPDVIGEIDIGDFLDLPAPTAVPVEVVSTSVNLAAVATSLSIQQSVTADGSTPTVIPLRKRQGSCQPFSSFAQTNPDITPGTVSAFQSYQPWQAASGALGTYGLPIYEGTNSVGPKNGLLSVVTYNSYDPNVCKAKCDSLSSCASFAIWRERVPTQKYDANTCPSPSTDAAYQTKCLYYSFKLAASDATNKGQWTNNGKFNVVQTSVKFFNKDAFVPAAVDGFSGPTGDWGVCAPQGLTADGDDVQTAAGKFHADVLARTPGPMTTAIDPSFCASTCKSITSGGQPDDVSGIKLNCNMFSLFLLRANGKDAWQCQYWTKDLDASRNTNCGPNKLVVASWKYVTSGSNAVAPYVNTKPQITPPTCTGSDSSTFGVRCIEDFKTADQRSDFATPWSSKGLAYDETHYEYQTSKLIGFTDPSNLQWYIHNNQWNQLDATKLATDGFFGMARGYGNNQFQWNAAGFVFDLESIDLATWFVNSMQAGDTLSVCGLRNGQVVGQCTDPVAVPLNAGDQMIHATGLLDLGFKKIDGLRFINPSGRGGWVVMRNLVITRYAVPNARREVQTIGGSVSDAPELSRRDDADLVPTGAISTQVAVAFKSAD
ncbi:glycoside hydrolase [Pseudozyma hubeiensis SY62]|uniref:Glycoside hydrolase n=1 Tax=Pseudozyma hubeiensis (strain SY62) TaxID=1305764 RepID=R9PD35_PSEHS|nr:glycoside hydrolase [Pseudozyma hubeiensis SY62]GAC96000.1 glycoside hydrolase [Pseudozyma hubeiensis SY62]